MSSTLPVKFPYLPSLGEDGWISDDLQRADRAFAHLFLSEYSQTEFYPDQVTSIPKIVQENMGDPLATAQALEEELTKYFERYFNNVEVFADYPPGQESSKSFITLAVMFQGHDGKNYSLSETAQIMNSKVVRVENLNNYGT